MGTFDRRTAALALLLACGTGGIAAVHGTTLDLVALQVDVKHTDPAAVAAKVLAPLAGAPLWVLMDVNQTEVFRRAAAGPDAPELERVSETEMDSARDLVLFSSARLRLVDRFTLSSLAVEIDRRTHSPRVLRFQVLPAAGDLLVVVDDLAGSGQKVRRDQLRGLNDWVKARALPVVVVGSFGLDARPGAAPTSFEEGFALLTAGDLLHWIAPTSPAATECRSGEVTEFVFLGGGGGWTASATIPPGSCPEATTHRPVVVRLSDPASSAAGGGR